MSTKPKQQSLPVSVDGKRWAKAQMEAMGITQDELGAKVGCSGAMISMLLNEDRVPPVTSSRYWRDIVLALGGEPPTISEPSLEEIDRHKRIILNHWNDLTDEERAHVAAIVEILTRKR